MNVEKGIKRSHDNSDEFSREFLDTLNNIYSSFDLDGIEPSIDKLDRSIDKLD
jgi:hypothetical protein